VGGYGDGLFGPNDDITREQLSVMVWRYAGSPAATDKELHFADAGEAGDFALDSLRWAVENGILNGYGDGRLGPKGQATRAQAAAMLMRYLRVRKFQAVLTLSRNLFLFTAAQPLRRLTWSIPSIDCR